MKKSCLALFAILTLALAGSALAYPSCSECNCNVPCNTQCLELGQLTTCGEIDEGTGPCIDSIGCNWNPRGALPGGCELDGEAPALEDGESATEPVGEAEGAAEPVREAETAVEPVQEANF